MCPKHCGNLTCNAVGECCDESCLGCEVNDTKACLSCRHFSIGSDSNRICVQKCPSHLFVHENSRCISEDDCHRVKRPVFIKYDYNLHEYPYIPVDGKCQIDCPANSYPEGESGARRCQKCDGASCKKECPAGNIDSKATAQRYRGCTHIKGSLLINIRNQGSCKYCFFFFILIVNSNKIFFFFIIFSNHCARTGNLFSRCRSNRGNFIYCAFVSIVVAGIL